jgi:Protein of unknown function (DUF3052)
MRAALAKIRERVDVSAETVKKLRIRGGQKVLVLNANGAQRGLLADLPADARLIEAGEADVVILFAQDSSELREHLWQAARAAQGDRLFWICYPKKGTAARSDLSRDRVRELSTEAGVEAVSQVALDDTWSALRFRPAELYQR